MLRSRPFIVEALTAAGLIAAPFVLPHLGFTPTTIDRILVWGLFGIGFDILFGFTGLLSFGQSAFFGTGGGLPAHGSELPVCDGRGSDRHGLGQRDRLRRGADRAQTHRHLFRHDHRGDRRGVLLRRIQSAVGLYGRRKRIARRADPLDLPRLHHDSFRIAVVALRFSRILVPRRHHHCAAHRAFAGRRRAARHPRQSSAGGRRRPQSMPTS
jgi:hypothetical protein